MTAPLVRQAHDATNVLHSLIYFAPEAEQPAGWWLSPQPLSPRDHGLGGGRPACPRSAPERVDCR
jgi:hypothetical protein